MASTEINNYITKRYDRWLDHAKYHCAQCGIADESMDVLNEVILSLLQKDESYIDKLYQAKGNGYTELDYYVLKMIKLNASSPTSPYQFKYRNVPIDENIHFSAIEIEESSDEEPDRSGYILERMHEIRESIEELGFSEKAMSVFEFRFFQDGVFKEFDGDMNIKELYDLYSKIINIVKKKINKQILF